LCLTLSWPDEKSSRMSSLFIRASRDSRYFLGPLRTLPTAARLLAPARCTCRDCSPLRLFSSNFRGGLRLPSPFSTQGSSSSTPSSFTLFATQPYHPARHFASSAFSLLVPGARHLERSRKQADEHPDDASYQTTYLRALLKRDPADVISRLETRRYAVDSSALSTYRQALKRCNRPESTLDDATLFARIDPRSVLYAPHSQYSPSAYPYPQYAYPYSYDYYQAPHQEEAAANDRGDKPDSPLFVQVVGNKQHAPVVVSRWISFAMAAGLLFVILKGSKGGSTSTGPSFSPFLCFCRFFFKGGASGICEDEVLRREGLRRSKGGAH